MNEISYGGGDMNNIFLKPHFALMVSCGKSWITPVLQGFFSSFLSENYFWVGYPLDKHLLKSRQ